LKERQAYYVYDEEGGHWVVSDTPNPNTVVIPCDTFIEKFVEFELNNDKLPDVIETLFANSPSDALTFKLAVILPPAIILPLVLIKTSLIGLTPFFTNNVSILFIDFSSVLT
jgi:hypothetical protein